MVVYGWNIVYGANRRSLQERKALVEALPWVTLLNRPRPCQGYMPKRGRCAKSARWRYRHSAKAPLFWNPTTKYNEGGRKLLTRYYCWDHVRCRGVAGDMYEEHRCLSYWESKELI